MRKPNKIPRRAHCTGCGVTFHKMHDMFNHRNNNRCGGRFLPIQERLLLHAAKENQQQYEHLIDIDAEMARYHYFQARDFLSRFYRLRSIRLAKLR